MLCSANCSQKPITFFSFPHLLLVFSNHLILFFPPTHSDSSQHLRDELFLLPQLVTSIFTEHAAVAWCLRLGVFNSDELIIPKSQSLFKYQGWVQLPQTIRSSISLFNFNSSMPFQNPRFLHPLKTNECPLKRGNVKRKGLSSNFPIFQRTWHASFQGT